VYADVVAAAEGEIGVVEITSKVTTGSEEVFKLQQAWWAVLFGKEAGYWAKSGRWGESVST
jgi:hypothetical protein